MAFFNATRYENVPRRKSQFPIERYRTMMDDSPYCSPMINNNGGIKTKVKRRRTINHTMQSQVNPYEASRRAHHMSRLVLDDEPRRSPSLVQNHHIDEHDDEEEEEEDNHNLHKVDNDEANALEIEEPEDEDELNERDFTLVPKGPEPEQDSEEDGELDQRSASQPASIRASSVNETDKHMKEFNEVIEQVLESSRRSLAPLETGDHDSEQQEHEEDEHDAALFAKNTSQRKELVGGSLQDNFNHQSTKNVDEPNSNLSHTNSMANVSLQKSMQNNLVERSLANRSSRDSIKNSLSNSSLAEITDQKPSKEVSSKHSLANVSIANGSVHHSIADVSVHHSMVRSLVDESLSNNKTSPLQSGSFNNASIPNDEQKSLQNNQTNEIEPDRFSKLNQTALPPLVNDTDFEAMPAAYESGVEKSNVDSLSRMLEQSSSLCISKRSNESAKSLDVPVEEEESEPMPEHVSHKALIKTKNSTVNYMADEDEELPSFKNLSAISGMSNKTLDVGNDATNYTKTLMSTAASRPNSSTARKSSVSFNRSSVRHSMLDHDDDSDDNHPEDACSMSENESDGCADRAYTLPPKSDSSDDEEDDQRNDSEDEKEEQPFKAPKAAAPKKRTYARQAMPASGRTLKGKLPSAADTFVNKTPAIIYPEIDDEEERNVRRSHRVRVQPLAYWRNEKLKYKTDLDTKCMVVDGVEKGPGPDRGYRRSKTSKPAKRKIGKTANSPRDLDEPTGRERNANQKHEGSSDEDERAVKPKKACLYDPDAELSIHGEINKSMIAYSEKIKHETTEFFSKKDLVWKPLRSSENVFVAQMNRSNHRDRSTTSGYFQIRPQGEKRLQQSGNYRTDFLVMFGVLSVKINDKPAVIFKKMEFFTIERNTWYSIRNLRDDNALMYFTMVQESCSSSDTAQRPRHSAGTGIVRRTSK